MPPIIEHPNQISTTTCDVIGSSTECITQWPPVFYTQDRGNVSFSLSIIITILNMADKKLKVQNFFEIVTTSDIPIT